MRISISISCFLLLTIVPVFSQDWSESLKESIELSQNQEWEEAKELAMQALDEIEDSDEEESVYHSQIFRQLSIISFNSSQFEDAISFSEKEVQMLVEIDETGEENFFGAIENLAAIAHSTNNHQISYKYLAENTENAMDFYGAESIEYAIWKGNLGVACYNLKNFNEASENFSESVPYLVDVEINNVIFTIQYTYSQLLIKKGKDNEAINLLDKLSTASENLSNNGLKAQVVLARAGLVQNKGDYESADKLYKQAIDLEKDNSVGAVYPIILANASINLFKMNKYEEALKLNNELLGIIKQTNNQYLIATINNASILFHLGKNDEAKKELEKAKNISSEKKDIHYVNALKGLSTIYMYANELTKANEYINEAISVNEEKQFSENNYSIYSQKAKILIKLSKYKESLEVANKALTFAKQEYGENSQQTSNALSVIAGAMTKLGQYNEARNKYNESIDIYDQNKANKGVDYAILISNFSTLLQTMGEYYEAENYLIQSVGIFTSTNNTNNIDYINIYENLGLLYYSTARYNKALTIFEAIVEKKAALLGGDSPLVANSIANLAKVKVQQADFTKAEQLFNKARKLVNNKSLDYGHLAQNQAVLYLKMGNYKVSKSLFEESLSVFEESLGKTSTEYSTSLENLAIIYQIDKNNKKAKELLEQVLAIDEQLLGENHPLYSKTLHNLASIYEEEGDFEKANVLYNKALVIDKNVFGENHPSYASTLNNIATLEQEKGNYDLAIQHFEKVKEIRKTILGENHPDYVFSLYGLATINHKMKNFVKAKEIYEDIIEKYLSIIHKQFPSLSESEKEAFYNRIKKVFNNYKDFVVDFQLYANQPKEEKNNLLKNLYNLQLQTKALLLNASNKVRNTILASGNEQLISLFNSWIEKKETIAKLYSYTKSELAESGLNIPALEQEANQIEKELSLKSSLFSGSYSKAVITWENVKENLKEDELAIEVIRIKKNIKEDSVTYATLFVDATSEFPKISVQKQGKYLESGGFKKYKNSIIYKVADKNSYNDFWKHNESFIPENIKTIYVSADGVYNKVNLITLKNMEKDEYLLEKYNIRMISNTRELAEKPNENMEVNSMNFLTGFPTYDLQNITATAKNDEVSAMQRATFGSVVSPLPGTLKEVEEIEKILTENGLESKTYKAEESSENNIKKIVKPNILHIATHGFFMEDVSLKNKNEKVSINPLLRSGLLFSGAQNTFKGQKIGNGEDGVLTSLEIMNMELDNTELVAISACETGLGEIKNGEGVYGLQRAFMVAGAKNLIMSLWKVNDETTQLLMTNFYKNWMQEKMTKIEAFNEAINFVKQKHESPYFWGAFVMLGK